MCTPAPRGRGMPTRAETAAVPLRAEDAFRNTYQLDVPRLPAGFAEDEPGCAPAAHLERPTAEFGPDFSICRRQEALTIGGQIRRIDLELYSRATQSIVLVDLKIGTFEDRDVGQHGGAKAQPRAIGPSTTRGLL